MTLLGVGTDIVEISRIEAICFRHENRFVLRILSQAERLDYQKSCQAVRFLARRFAAKEAASKALGTGMRAGVTFRDFVVGHDPLGKPSLILLGHAAEVAKVLGIKGLWLSIADERHYAVATVILTS